MASDELFCGQSTQFGTLPHKDKSKVVAASDEIFKGQTAQLKCLPNKPSRKKRSAVNVHKVESKAHRKSGKDGRNNLFVGVVNRMLVVSLFIVILFLITILGGVAFMQIETENDSTYKPFNDCFLNGKKMKKPTKDVLDDVQECIKKANMLSELRYSTLFSWSLYATVGYGHRFPFSFLGQLVSVFFAWLFIPVYMALKIEFGEILAINILFMGQKIKNLMIRFGPECITRKMKQQSYHPSDLTLALLLSILFSTFIILLTLIVMFTSSLGFFDGFYLTLHTVFQVGLGDITPVEKWPTFVFVIPLVMLGDTLASYLFYYVNGIYRLQLHRFVICMTGCHEQDKETVPEGQQLVLAKSVGDFVTVTNHTMPLRATSAEIVRKGHPSKETEGLDVATLLELGRTENTQTTSNRLSYGPRKKKDKTKTHNSPPGSEKLCKTAKSVRTQEDALEKTITEARSQKSNSPKPKKTMGRDDLITATDVRRTPKKTVKGSAEEVPLLNMTSEKEERRSNQQKCLKPIVEEEPWSGLKQSKRKKKVLQTTIETAPSPHLGTLPIFRANKPRIKKKSERSQRFNSSREKKELHKKKYEDIKKEHKDDDDEADLETAITSKTSELTPRSAKDF